MEGQRLAGGAAVGAAVAALTAWLIKRRQDQSSWESVIDKISHGVVVVRVSSVKAFDMNDAGFSYATGFVVDAELGLILTNRHVVTTGPVTADAVLLNKEEIELLPIYADPVHDFGFFKYEPSAVKYMTLQQIPLAPRAARVGLEVRVIGNDSGEKINILSGTLARLDRAAPHYGSHTFNDLNTFYYSCASNTSGGSSGSPVVNSKGQAIALNAGASTKSASSYYLPLERPARALRLLQHAMREKTTYRGARASIPRGCLCCVFVHRAFGELRRLGLSDATEGAVRSAMPAETGMLVVDQVVPGGPAASVGGLQPGDVLLGIHASDLEPGEGHRLNGAASNAVHGGNGHSSSSSRRGGGSWRTGVCKCCGEGGEGGVTSGASGKPAGSTKGGVHRGGSTKEGGGRGDHLGAFCTSFIELEEVLDSHVNRPVCVLVQRGGVAVSVRLRVADLHSFSPTSVLECGGSIVHSLSYQQARNWNLAAGSVHTAYSGYMLSNAGVPSRAILLELNNVPTPTLDAFYHELQQLPDGARVPLRYAQPFSQHQERLVVITIDRTWFPCVRYSRDDLTGQWHSSACPPPPPAPPPVPQHVSFTLAGPSEVQAVTPCLVRVLFDIPYQIDGVACLKYVGCGLVVDHRLGLVLLDRNTVPVVPGDARVEFASTVEVPAVVRFLHPTHNFALVQYDPANLAADAAVASATLSHDPIEVGEECVFVGLSKVDASALPVFQPCVVRESCIMEAGLPSIPRYRAINEDIIRFDLGMALEDTIGGVFVDSSGHVKAMWAAYATCATHSSGHDDDFYEQFEGLPIGIALPFVEALARAADIDEARPPPWQQQQQQQQQPATAIGPSATLSSTASSGGPLHFLDAELRPISLSTACGTSEGSGLGLAREWAERLSAADTEKRQALLVTRLSPRVRAMAPPRTEGEHKDARQVTATASANGAKAASGAASKEEQQKEAQGVQEGDLLLAVDGTPVATFLAVEDCVRHKPSATVTVLRDGVERSLAMSMPKVASDGTVHIVMWCGLVVQAAYRAVLERGFEPAQGGVYISYYLFGSPAHKHKLVPKHWIIEVNGVAVPDIPGFVAMIETLKHGESCRVRTCDLTGRVSAYTLKTDHMYWSSFEVKREGTRWHHRHLGQPATLD